MEVQTWLDFVGLGFSAFLFPLPIGSMYAIYGNIYHQYTPNVSIYTIHGSYGLFLLIDVDRWGLFGSIWYAS